MKVKALQDFLSALPAETEVYYRDGNFGGPSEELRESDVTFCNGTLLISSPYWVSVDEPE
jgi:hypothetical protein